MPGKDILIKFSSMKESLNPLVRRLTLRQLRAFDALVRAGTITGAAQILLVTPPAVLLQLRQLEETIGMPLFERTSDGAQPTEAGREILNAVARIDAALNDCVAATEAMRNMDGGMVSIGVVSTAKYFAPRALADFKRRHPAAELRLLVGNREETIAALEGFAFDLAVMGRPPEHFPVEQAVIGDHPHVIVASPDHKLAGRRRIALNDLRDETFLIREHGSGTRMLAERLFASAGMSIPAGMEMGSNETIKQAVIAGMGIAFISAHTTAAEVEDGRLVLLDVAGLPVVRQWFVVRRQEKRLLPMGLALWDFLAEVGATFLPVPGKEHPVRQVQPAPRAPDAAAPAKGSRGASSRPSARSQSPPSRRSVRPGTAPAQG